MPPDHIGSILPLQHHGVPVGHIRRHRQLDVPAACHWSNLRHGMGMRTEYRSLGSRGPDRPRQRARARDASFTTCDRKNPRPGRPALVACALAEGRGLGRRRPGRDLLGLGGSWKRALGPGSWHPGAHPQTVAGRFRAPDRAGGVRLLPGTNVAAVSWRCRRLCAEPRARCGAYPEDLKPSTAAWYRNPSRRPGHTCPSRLRPSRRPSSSPPLRWPTGCAGNPGRR